MKIKLFQIILFLSLKALSLERILIDELDINVLKFNLEYFKNDNKYLSLSYYDNTSHYLKKYDNNEKLIENKKDSYKEKIKSLIYYQNSDNYIIHTQDNYFSNSIQIFYNGKIIKLNLISYKRIYGFSIMEDNTLLIIMDGEKFSIQNYLIYNYPPKSEPDEQFTDSSSSLSLFTVIGLKNSFVTVSKNENQIYLKIRNKNFSLITSKILSIKLDDEVIASYIDLNNRNIFLLCFIGYKMSGLGSVKCSAFKLDNNKNVNSEEYLTVFDSCPYLLFSIKINLIENNKLALGCSSANSVFISFLEYSSNKLKKGTFFNKKVISDSKNSFFYPYINYYKNKGYLLYYFYGNENSQKTKIYKTYFNPACVNFEMILNYVNEKQTFSFNDFIKNGIEGIKHNFKINYIDKNINIYLKNKKINAGETQYSQDEIFQIDAKYSPQIMKILFSMSGANYNCSGNIKFRSYDIKIGDKTEKCIKKKKGDINNILSHELVYEFDKASKLIEFKIKYENKVTNNELFYIYKQKQFKCKMKDINYVLCKSPIPDKEIKSINIKNEYKIESKFVCENIIFIDTLKIKDKYILEIFKAPNLRELTQGINQKYNPSQEIKKFSLDMITYYYWFSCYSHCNINDIQNNICCKNYLKEWQIFDYKIFKNTLIQYIQDYINKSIEIPQELKNELNEIKIEIFKFIIFKNEKYKKYVITFDGYEAEEYFISTLLSPKKIFEIKGIKVNSFFWRYFKLIENDLFSEELINDMNKNKDYQIIFIGHSFGGAIATLSIFSFVKNYLENRDPILITFGQPRVGNEEFAKKFNELIPNVYRIANINDKITSIPPINEKLYELYNKITNNDFMILFGRMKQIFELVRSYINMPLLIIKIFYIFLDDLKNNLKDKILDYLVEQATEPFIGYCHIGGLYILNKEENSFIHCKNFGNEETNHYICKNFNWNVKDFSFRNNEYFLKDQKINERCIKEVQL